jgi:hypothetical protein
MRHRVPSLDGWQINTSRQKYYDKPTLCDKVREVVMLASLLYVDIVCE